MGAENRVKQPLNKWFNRGSASGYKLEVSIPSNVYLTNENEYWYDRVMMRPYIGTGTDHYYYQVLDYDHWEGATKDLMPHNQRYGMDYMWYDDYNNVYRYTNGSPNTPYIDGYNIQNNEVQVTAETAPMGTNTDNGYSAYADADKNNLYAQTGTRAVMRKPLVRLWTTLGSDLTGNTREDYYTDTEGEANFLNIHVENMYWWDYYALNGRYLNGAYRYEKYLHNYEVDGGSRGTLILPVVTNILPYGIVPVADDGTLFCEYNAKNAQKTAQWTLYQRSADSGADKSKFKEAADEKEKYEVKVTYEQIELQGEDGTPTGNYEGRYVVRFIPKADADGGEIAEEARLASGNANIFSLKTFTIAAPNAQTKEGAEGDLERNYQNNRTYVTSKIDGFKYLVDEDIQGNEYTVGSYGTFRFNTLADIRLDAVQKTYTYNGGTYERGNIPDDKLAHAYENDTPLIGRLTKYEETQEFNVEDYFAAGLKDKAVLSNAQKDFNQNGRLTHNDYDLQQDIADIGVMNTLKIRTSAPRLSVTHYAAPDRTQPGQDSSGAGQSFDYSDDVWYSAKIENKPASPQNYWEIGAVHHAKMTVAFHLPDAVSYSGSAKWNVENNDGDSYNNLDDFCMEYYDPETKEVQKLSQKALREQGWGVELIYDSAQAWQESDLSHEGQVVVFAITTPKSAAFNGYDSYVNGAHPAGYFPSGAVMNFKIRTRVDNAPDSEVMDEPDEWDEAAVSQVYVTIHDTDGSYAVRDNGTFAEAGDLTGVSNGYNGFTVANEDGHAFKEQSQEQCFWNEAQKTSDQKDDTGALTEDYDRDGEYDPCYVTNTSGKLLLLKPKSTVRLDTSKPRMRVNDPDSDRYIMEDAHVRSAYQMKMMLDQAVNESTSLNTFIVNYNLPYYGTNMGTMNPADASNGKAMKQNLLEIKTGKWEIPLDAPIDATTRGVLEEHLKVYIEVLVSDDPRAETGYYYPGKGDSKNWQRIGNQAGYAIGESTSINIAETYPGLMGKIYQIRWVIKTEAFTAAGGTHFNEVQAPIYYPVPVGFRLDVDADEVESGKQEMDEVDPERLNKEEPTQNVLDNTAYVMLQSEQFGEDDGAHKHTNHFVTAFPKYDDKKYAQISQRARGGFYVDPEVPVVNLSIQPMYFSGSATLGFQWEDNVIVNSETSNMLKYKVGYESIGKQTDPDIEPDNVTNPGIAVAVPYVDRLDEKHFEYVDYQQPDANGHYQDENYYIGDNYGKPDDPDDKEDPYRVTTNLDDKTPLWTWYVIEKQADGSTKTLLPSEVAAGLGNLQLESMAFTRKPIDMTTNQRTIVNFKFRGKLLPGQTLMVEFMVPVEESDGNAVPTDMLQCKAFGFKKGNFDPYLKNQGALDNLGYEFDTSDVNSDGNVKDMMITRLSSAIIFKSTSTIVQNKTTTTELDSNITSRAVPVPEGKDYEYKISMINKGSATSYNELVFYDVLPELGDNQTHNLNTANGDKIPRNSQWHGWVKPESIKLVTFGAQAGGSETEEIPVSSGQYETWVGPIVKENGQFVLKDTSILPTQEELQKQETFDTLTTSDAAKKNYFVKLDELLQLPDGDQKDELIKGIRAIWVQMEADYELAPAARLKLSVTLHSPLNLPQYVGTLDPTPDDTASDPYLKYNKAVADYSGWNTFVSRWNNGIIENAKAGVYQNAPTGRGYIGSYIWNDADYSAVPDAGEGDYGTEDKTGRVHLKNATVDLDFDGTPDDPGINGVRVQLLTENGYPCNREGEAVIPEPGVEGHYILIDEETGKPITVPMDQSGKVYVHSKAGGPVEFESESDYYGKDGYYVLSNLKPGKYNLKFTFPEDYNEYSITTTSLGESATPVSVYRDGELVYCGVENNASPVRDLPAGRLVVQTAAPIAVDPVEEENFAAYDQKMASYQVGLGRAYTYGGTVWLDETTVEDPTSSADSKIESDGYLTAGEALLKNVEVSVYDIADLSKPCVDGDGNPAVTTTGDDGFYQFRLKPGRQYIVRVKDRETGRLLKPTPWTFTNDPLKADNDNDLSKIGKDYETKAFTAQIPYDGNNKPLFEGNSTQSFKYNSNIDLGMINAGRGYLGKFVWNDLNYNGIMDADEPGIENVTVTLESYYFDGTDWIPFGAERDIKTNSAGAYVFDNVMSYYVSGDVKYLTGYRMRIDPDKNKDIFKQYAITHHLVNGGNQDSDLISDPASADQYYLHKDYIIIAVAADEDTDPENKKSYQGKDYDISDAEILLTYDAGLAEYEYSTVEGIIWQDNGAGENAYNGVMDADEQGIQGVSVSLEQYYKDAGGKLQLVTTGSTAADGRVFTGTQTVLSGADGVYHFENVPAFLWIDGGKKLVYYRIRAEVPGGYGVTRYQQPGTVNSDWITNEVPGSENYLTAPNAGDYFLLAKPADALQNPPYTLTDGDSGAPYDIVHKQGDISGYDGGLLQEPATNISGKLWEDKNYDGIQNQAADGTDEPGIGSATVKLTQSYYDADAKSWKPVAGFTKEAVTNQDGIYSFENLPTYVKVDDVYRLAGYQLSVTKLPPDTNYGITRYHQGADPTKDSDLRSGSQSLVQEGEYLILADEAKANSGGGYPYRAIKLTDAFHDGVMYDLLTAKPVSGYDGGLVAYTAGAIAGVIWHDQNYNGVRDQGETGDQAVTVQLERWYYQAGRWQQDKTFTETCLTQPDGAYRFENLPTYVELQSGERYLAGYTLKLDSVPDGYGITLYRYGDDRSADSDLRSDNLLLVRDNEYIITAQEAVQNDDGQTYNDTAVEITDADHQKVVYDFLLSRETGGQDGGLVKEPAASISGKIWIDDNYNGIQDDTEPGYSGGEIAVLLTRSYYDGRDWVEDAGFNETPVKTTAAKDGSYSFPDLPTYVVVGGQRYLAGYQVKLSGLPEGHGATLYRQGNNRAIDSDLDKDTLALVREDEYLILAGTAQVGSSNYTAVTVTDAYHKEAVFDTLLASDISNRDAGLHAYSKGTVKGIVWDDQNYDGIQVDTEAGKDGVKVVLECFYFNGQTWLRNNSFLPPSVTTVDGGKYRFDNLSTFVEVSHKKYLAGYRVKLENLPDGYEATRYRQGTDRAKDSDLKYDDLYLVRDGEYLVVAGEVPEGGNASEPITVQELDRDTVTYDIQTARTVSGQDGGILTHRTGSITGKIWKDTDYDGIQDETDALDRDVTVELHRFYYKDGAWEPDGYTASVPAYANAGGSYRFDSLATFVEVDGVKYLAGYRLKLSSIPEGYGVTRYYQGNDRGKDSDLVAENNALVQNGEYLILAQPADASSNPAAVAKLPGENGETAYDLLKPDALSGHDGGLVPYTGSSISGRIWKDVNYNGLQEDGEAGISGLTVKLKTYYYDGSAWQAANYPPVEAVTQNDGGYLFKDLSTYVEIDGVKYLAGYQLDMGALRDVDGLLNEYGVTRYHQGSAAEKDSDLVHDTLLLNEPDEFLILADQATANADGSYNSTVRKLKDTQGKEVYYDLLLPKKEEHRDGGLAPFQNGEIYGLIWQDDNYNGIQETGEAGIENIEVCLTRSYYKDSMWVADESFSAKTSTVAGGLYRFDGLSTYVEVDGQKYLAGYQLDLTSLPENYGVTRYHQGSDPTKDSDLIAESLSLVRDGEYLVTAGQAEKNADGGSYNYSTVTVTDLDLGKVTYDYLTAREVSAQDAGLVPAPEGSISGVIWKDENYDGLRTEGEPGLSGVKVVLERSFFNGKSWQQDDSFPSQTVTSNSDGSYRFDGLAAYVLRDGKMRLTGYRLSVQNLPEGYEITRYRQGNDRMADSDLNPEDRALVREGEYLAVAQKAVGNETTGEYNYSVVAVKNGDGELVTYDMLTAGAVSGQDGGLLEYPTGTIKGVIWDDQNYDGLRSEGEPGISGVTVELERYRYDSETGWQADAGWVQEQVETSSSGEYLFEDLDTRVYAEGKSYLAGYRLKVLNAPEDYAVTYYRQGDNPAKDSDLIEETFALVREGEYLIPAGEAVKNEDGAYHITAVPVTDQYHQGVVYDLLTASEVTGQDGGFTQYPNGSITGLIWDDLNYNGLQDAEEPGYEGTTVILTRSYFDPQSGQWIPDTSFTPMNQTTGADGIYRFEQLDTQVVRGSKAYLAGYQLTLAELPGDRAVTKYWRGDDRLKDSNLIAATRSLVKDGEYIPVAGIVEPSAPKNGTQITVTEEKVKVTYDILTAREVTGYDGGYSAEEGGSLTGILWEDQNFDGTRSEDEQGISDVSVTLSRYLKVGDTWQLDEDFTPHTVKTDANGTYFFDALDGYCKIDGEKHLYGYRVTADLSTLPQGAEVTQYRVGGDPAKDSDLIDKTGALVPEGEYLLVVGPADYSQEHNPENVVDGYDIVRGIDVSGQDGGVVISQTGSITGIIWDDVSYDGIRDSEELGVSGVPVTLKRYFYDQGAWVLDDSFRQETLTDANGEYRFDGLLTAAHQMSENAGGALVRESKLLSYRVEVEELSGQWAVGKYHQGDDPAKDSDLLAENLSLLTEEEYIILAKPVQPEDPDHRYHTIIEVADTGAALYYDTLYAEEVTGYDAGLSLFENGVVSGTAWLDQDKNGILDEGEPRLPGLEIHLEQYVRKDGEWLLTDEAVQTVQSGEDGEYSFEDLPLYLEEFTENGESQRYLVGYRLNVEAVPQDYEITSYMTNHGIDDSKLLLEHLALSDEAYELDGCLVLSRKADYTTNTAYVTEGFDLVKPRAVDQMHAGFWEIIKNTLFPSTGEPAVFRIFALLCVASGALLLMLLLYRRRKKD